MTKCDSKTIMKNNKTILIAFITFFFHSIALAQDGMSIWYGHGAEARLTKEWRVSARQLFMFSGNPRKLSRIQNSLNVSYRYNKRVRLGFGYQLSVDPRDLGKQARSRLTGRVSYYTKWKGFRVMNTFRAEWHLPERSKFEYRLRYAMRIHPRNLDLPLRARPFMTNEFHYYLSGDPLWYRDAEGERVVEQSPNGLHAHRFTLGLRITPLKRTNLTMRFMRQTEFNLGSKYRRINVEDPRNGRIRRRFNNFSVFIVTVSHRLKLK